MSKKIKDNIINITKTILWGNALMGYVLLGLIGVFIITRLSVDAKYWIDCHFGIFKYIDRIYRIEACNSLRWNVRNYSIIFGLATEMLSEFIIFMLLFIPWIKEPKPQIKSNKLALTILIAFTIFTNVMVWSSICSDYFPNLIAKLHSIPTRVDFLFDCVFYDIIHNKTIDYIHSCLFLPIFEELLFRKKLMSLLDRYGAAVSIIGSTVLFSFAHGRLDRFPDTFALGVTAALVYYLFKDIRYYMLIHIIYNTCCVIGWEYTLTANEIYAKIYIVCTNVLLLYFVIKILKRAKII